MREARESGDVLRNLLDNPMVVCASIAIWKDIFQWYCTPCLGHPSGHQLMDPELSKHCENVFTVVQAGGVIDLYKFNVNFTLDRSHFVAFYPGGGAC